MLVLPMLVYNIIGVGAETEPSTVSPHEWGYEGPILALLSWVVTGELVAPELMASGKGSKWHSMVAIPGSETILGGSWLEKFISAFTL